MKTIVLTLLVLQFNHILPQEFFLKLNALLKPEATPYHSYQFTGNRDEIATLSPRSELVKDNNIQGFTGTLIVSAEEPMYCPSHIERNQASLKLATLLGNMYGINVLLTMSPWPRDHITVYSNGEYAINLSNNRSRLIGGEYLPGNDFAIHAEPLSEMKRNNLNNLGFKNIYSLSLVDITHWFNSVIDDPEGVKGFNHIDIYFNIWNYHKIIFSYDHEIPVNAIKPIVEATGYSLITIPVEEAKYYAIGFIELGDHLVIDNRATKTIQKLVDLGYKVIPSPEPFLLENHYNGSVRCRTLAIPFDKSRLLLDKKPPGPGGMMMNSPDSIFFTLDGNPVKLSFKDNALAGGRFVLGKINHSA